MLTGFEQWLEQNGWTLTDGLRGAFNTYTNLSRLWENNNRKIRIGILAVPRVIGVLYPKMDFMPTSEFHDYIEHSEQFTDDEKIIEDGITTRIHYYSTKKYMEFLDNTITHG